MAQTKVKQIEVDKEETQLDRIERLSQKLFGKPSKDIKYLIVTNFVHTQLLEEEVTRTGLYQWMNVFNGDIKYPRQIDDYSKYDIVQVNMSAQDLHLAGDVREQLGEKSKTKLVLNNDYTTEMWQRAFDYLSTVRREAVYADMLFGTEYYQVTALAELTGRKVFVMPHPADIRRLKALPIIPKKKIITTIWRRYDNHIMIPALCVRNHGLTTQLIGYDNKVDPKVWSTTTLYDYVFKASNFFEFCDQMRESELVFDPFTYHSYSRATVDAAAMGIPVVGTNRTQSMQTCYPYTTVDPFDVHTSRKLIRKILDDKTFREKVVKTALNNVEFYNHTNSKERYLISLEEGLKKLERKPMVYKKETGEKGTGSDILKIISNEKTARLDKKASRKETK